MVLFFGLVFSIAPPPEFFFLPTPLSGGNLIQIQGNLIQTEGNLIQKEGNLIQKLQNFQFRNLSSSTLLVVLVAQFGRIRANLKLFKHSI